jgi:hypothetical protein
MRIIEQVEEVAAGLAEVAVRRWQPDQKPVQLERGSRGRIRIGEKFLAG